MLYEPFESRLVHVGTVEQCFVSFFSALILEKIAFHLILNDPPLTVARLDYIRNAVFLKGYPKAHRDFAITRERCFIRLFVLPQITDGFSRGEISALPVNKKRQQLFRLFLFKRNRGAIYKYVKEAKSPDPDFSDVLFTWLMFSAR